VGEEHLLQANSLNALHQNIARLLGPAIGGAVAAVSGLTGVALLDSVSFLLPAGMIALVHASGAVEKSEVGHAAEEAAGRWKRVWQEWIAGLSLVRRERLVATILVVFGISALGEGVFGVMFVVWVKKVLSGGALQLGWFMSAQAVGGLLGGLISGLLSRHFAAVRLAGFGAIAFGLLDMCLFSYPLLFSGVWIGLGIIALVGIPGVAGMSARTTLFQSEVRDEYRGRVFGMLGTTGGLLMIIGTLIAGAVGGIVGPIALLNVFQGGSYVLAGLVILIALGGLRLAQAGNERAPAASEL
jgi:MFS family permease